MDTFEEEWQNNFDKYEYEVKSTDSYIWYLYAIEVYRSAEHLASVSISTARKMRITSENERKENSQKYGSNYSTSRFLTGQEIIAQIDESQIRIAYFLLARAIELMLKAIKIEINPQAVIDPKNKHKLNFRKNGHDIITLFSEVGINLNKRNTENLKLLSLYPFVGTYPISMSLTDNAKQRKLKDELSRQLDVKDYFDVVELYDLALSKYSETRKINGKVPKHNFLKINFK